MMKRTNQQQQQQRRRCHTAGMTLVELLVVVAIIVGVLAVLLPLAKPLIDGRDVREASRQVNAYLAAAQARAIGTGKPVGVFFTRQGTDPAQVNKVYQMELMTSPVLYAGPTENAREFMENFLPKPITVAGTVITVPVSPPFLISSGKYPKQSLRISDEHSSGVMTISTAASFMGVLVPIIRLNFVAALSGFLAALS